MSSVHQKPTKKAKVELLEEDEGISLDALLQERRKRLQNVGSKSLSKSKKEELHVDDGVGKSPKVVSGSASKSAKVKRDDDFDEKPGKKNSAAKCDMVHTSFISFAFSFFSHYQLCSVL